MQIKSIRTRLIIALLLLAVGSLAILGTYNLWFFHRSNVETLTNQMVIQAQITEELAREYYPIERRHLLDAKIKGLSRRISLRITVIAADGRVIADSYEPAVNMENHQSRPEVSSASSGKIGSSIRHSDTLGENYLYTSVPLLSSAEAPYGVVRLAASMSPLESSFARVRSVFFAAFALTCLLAIGVSIRLAAKFTSPLEGITRVAQEMAEGRLDKRVHIQSGDELELLGHTLNQLASSLDDKINETLAEKHKLELILAHMSNAVILFDSFGRMVMFNNMAGSIFALTDSMLSKHNIQIIGSNALDRAVRESVTAREKRSIEWKFARQGKKRIFQLSLVPIAAEDEVSGVLCVFYDITAMQELHERQADFIANASHELATPLTSIKGFAETLLDGALSDRQLSERFITIIHSEAERMQRLVQDLLQLAKLDSDEYRKHIELQPVALDLLAASVTKELAARVLSKNITFICEESAPVTVLANQDWLKQVLLNLLDNAIKYTPPGGQITISWRTVQKFVHISIADTGIGIPASDLPLIFDRFYRVDKARSRTAGGTGLGLAIVKFMVEALGGRISADSKSGVGATFAFTVPVAEKNL